MDHFGNLISNIPAAWVTAGSWRCCIAGRDAPLVATYAEVAPDALAGLIGRGSTVELAVRNGNASQRLDVRAGEPLELWPTV